MLDRVLSGSLWMRRVTGSLAGVVCGAVLLSAAGVAEAQAAAPAALVAPALQGPAPVGLSGEAAAAKDAAAAATVQAAEQAPAETGIFPFEEGATPPAEPEATPPPAQTPVSEEEQALQDASVSARTTGAPAEVESLTTPFSQTVAGKDGAFTTSSSLEPVRFREATGDWQDIDLTLTEPDATDRVAPVSAPDSAGQIATNTDAAGGLVVVGPVGEQFSWTPQGMAAVERADDADSAAAVFSGAALSDATDEVVEFPRALPGSRAVRVEATVTGAKEEVVLPTRMSLLAPGGASAAGSYQNTFTMPAGVSARQGDGSDGGFTGVEFIDSAGEVVATYGGGTAFDSSKSAAGEPSTVLVRSELVSQAGTKAVVRISADPVWLAADARVFPVTIDPYFTSRTSLDERSAPDGGSSFDTYVDEAFPNQAYGPAGESVLKVGYRNVDNVGVRNSMSYLRLEIGDLEGSENNVLSALLYMNNSYSGTCTPQSVMVDAADRFWIGNITWNNRPGGRGMPVTRSFARGYNSSCPAAAEAFDVKDIVQRWSNANSVDRPWFYNDGFVIHTAVTSIAGYKRFDSGESGNPAVLSVRWENCTTYNGQKLCGAIRDKWTQMRDSGQGLGYPTRGETLVTGAGGTGAFSDFSATGGSTNSSIYWQQSTGRTFSVKNALRDEWLRLGGTNGYLGFPTSDEMCDTTAGTCRSSFEGGTVMWKAKDGSVTASTDGARLVQPVVNQRSARRLPIAIEIDPAWTNYRTQPRLQYRRGSAGAWTNIPLSTVTTRSGAAACSGCADGDPLQTTIVNNKRVFAADGNVVYWDAGTALGGVGGVLDVRVNLLTDRGDQAGTEPVVGVVYDPDAGQSASEAVGPGEVNLLTGDYRLSATDASAFGVSITRSAGSRTTTAGSKDVAAGAFGDQWVMGGVADGDEATYTQVVRTSATSLDVVLTNTIRVAFVRKADSTTAWIPESGAEDLTLTGDIANTAAGSTFTLTDLDGEVTTFTRASSAVNVWSISETTPSTTNGVAGAKTRFSYTVVDGKLRLNRVAAPNPALSETDAKLCLTAAITSLPAGCRVLAPTWTTSSATGSKLRVTDIALYATDPLNPTAAPSASTLVSYGYDTNGYLTTVTDPRTTSTTGRTATGTTTVTANAALTTSYAYDAGQNGLPGRVVTMTAPGELPWSFAYANGVVAGPEFDTTRPSSPGRLIGVSRATLAPGTVSTTNGTATWRVVYGVGLTKAAKGPHDLDYANTRWWKQDTPPTDATALYRPDAPSASNTSDPWAGDDTATRDWSTAAVTYLDVNGRETNTSTPVTGSTPAIDVTQYTANGNPSFTLSAANRATAMGQDDPAVTAAGGQSATTIWYDLGLPTAAVPTDRYAATDVNTAPLSDARRRADQLSTLTQYEKGPITTADRAVVERGPLHRVFTASTSNGPTSTSVGRSLTRTFYDENRPTDGSAKSVDLPTSTTSGVLAGMGTSFNGTASLVDTRTTRTAYDWRLGTATRTTVDMAGASAIERVSSYDSYGRVTSTSMPKDTAAGASATAGVTKTSYYGDTINTTGCPTTPTAALAKVWGGLPCYTGPGGAITGSTTGSATTLPGSVSEYTRAGVVVRVTETSGSMVRTSSTTLDAADRPRSVTVAGTGSGWSAGAGSTLTRSTAYTDAGDVASVTDTGANKSITTITDALGRVLSINDATGLKTTTGYDAQSRPVTSTQAGTISGAARSATTTNNYSTVTGQLVSGSDTLAGPTTATYDLDGSVVREAWTAAAGGALTSTKLTDTTDTPVSKTWARGFTTLLTNTVAENGHGQTITDFTSMPNLSTTVAGSERTRRYAYDTDGRLTSAADTRRVAPSGGGNATTQCTTRAWGFDANSNRTGEGSTSTSAACASTNYTVPSLGNSHGYDSADRITDATGGVGTVYDAFGRTTALGSTTNNTPAGGTGGTVKLTSVGYTVTDMAMSQTLYAGATTGTVEASQIWTVDPTGSRFAGSVITRNGISSTKMYRYDSTGDSPALIDEGDGTTTRPVTDLGGGMTALTTVNSSGATGITWQLSNLHGDIAATLPDTTGSAPLPLPAADEYGKTLDPGVGTPARYGWLGAKQRSAENITGFILMGIRLYNTTTGRFISTDPVPGGNASAYTYPADPVNSFDLDGKMRRGRQPGSQVGVSPRGFRAGPISSRLVRNGRLTSNGVGQVADEYVGGYLAAMARRSGARVFSQVRMPGLGRTSRIYDYSIEYRGRTTYYEVKANTGRLTSQQRINDMYTMQRGVGNVYVIHVKVDRTTGVVTGLGQPSGF